MTRTVSTEEYLDTHVTRIGNRFHARLVDIRKGKHVDEMACELREDIGYICYQMLRWHCKLGGTSPMATAARQRQKYKAPTGKIWWSAQLRSEQRDKK